MARRDISSRSPMHRLPPADRVFRALLRLFPAEFRGDFGEEMSEDFRDQHRAAARARGARGLTMLWIRTLADLIARAPREQADTLAADVRFAARMMRRYASSTAVLVALIAIGIGANAAVFGLADVLVLRPLPVPDARALVRISDGSGSPTFSHPDFLDLRDGAQAFAGVAAHAFTVVSFEAGAAAAPLAGEVVSGNYFDVLGIRPALGRLLHVQDDTMGGHPVVVISHALWRDRFGSAADAVGRTVRLNGHTFAIVGVTPASFSGSYNAFGSRFWAPIAMYREVRPRDLPLTQRGWGWLSLTARLRAGLTLDQGLADLGRMAADLDRRFPQGDPRQFSAVPASGVPEGMRAPARMVLAFATTIAVLVLVVTCANVAGVLQSRAVGRIRETSIRYAVGASRLRVVRQWLTESLLLALAGAVGGLLAGHWMHVALLGMIPGGTPADPTPPAAFDARVVAFTVGLALVAGLLFGLLPAWRSASRGEAALREFGAAMTGARSGTRTMRALVTIQVAVCLCLLVTAGLLTRSLRNARAFDPGFEPAGLVLAEFDPRRHGYDPTRARALFDQLSARLRGYPGVRGISRAIVVPLGGGEERLGYVIPGHRGRNNAPFISLDTNAVARGYFSTMGIPILQGRDFEERDAGAARRVAIVNETMARRYWGTANPVGQTFATAGRDGQPLEIVGVVKDIKYYSLSEEPRPYVYQFAEQSGAPAGIIHVRLSADAKAFAGILSRELAAIDPAVALDQVLTFDQLREQPLALRNAMAVLAAAFAGIALLLTVVGIYGTMSNAVGQRAREIGLRMAFGAAAWDVVRLVLRDGLLPVAIGLGAGLALGAWVTRLVASELFGVAPADPATHAAAIAAVLAAAVAALAIPARRAATVDPVEVLRA